MLCSGVCGTQAAPELRACESAPPTPTGRQGGPAGFCGSAGGRCPPWLSIITTFSEAAGAEGRWTPKLPLKSMDPNKLASQPRGSPWTASVGQDRAVLGSTGQARPVEGQGVGSGQCLGGDGGDGRREPWPRPRPHLSTASPGAVGSVQGIPGMKCWELCPSLMTRCHLAH